MKKMGVRKKTIVLIAMIIIVILLIGVYFYIKYYVEFNRNITGRATGEVTTSKCIDHNTVGYFASDVQINSMKCNFYSVCINIPKKNQARCIRTGKEANFEIGHLSSKKILIYNKINNDVKEFLGSETTTNDVNINLMSRNFVEFFSGTNPSAMEYKTLGEADKLVTSEYRSSRRESDGSKTRLIDTNTEQTQVECDIEDESNPLNSHSCKKDYYFIYKYNWMKNRKVEKDLNQKIEVSVPYLNEEWFDIIYYYYQRRGAGCKVRDTYIAQYFLCKDLNPALETINDGFAVYTVEGGMYVFRFEGRCMNERPYIGGEIDGAPITETETEYYTIDYMNGKCDLKEKI